MGNSPIPDSVKAQLKDGETVLWWGKPMGFPVVPFYGIAAAFSVFWFLIVLIGFGRIDVANPTTIIFPIVGVLFVSGALIALIDPSRRIYAVTNSRVIIKHDFILKRLVSLNYVQLQTIECRGNDKLGTLFFGDTKPVWMTDPTFREDIPAFYNISNPHEVENLIRDTFLTKGPKP